MSADPAESAEPAGPEPPEPGRPEQHPAPPEAARVPTERTFHGDTVVDDYEWLRDRENAQTRAYLEAENGYTHARTAHLAPLRERLFEEVRTRTQETDLSVPSRLGDYWYYGRTKEGEEYRISCRCPVSGPDDWDPPLPDAELAQSDVPGEEVLLDANELARGHDFFSLGGASVSPDAALLAYSTDTVGDERYTLRVRDLRTGELLPDEVPGTIGGATWDLTGTVLFYVTVDEAWRPDKVWRHRLGSDASRDDLVHHETDIRFGVGVGRTRTDRYLFLVSASSTTTEYRVLEADDAGGSFHTFAPRRQGVEYHLEHAVIAGRDRFLVLHNDDAENFALATAPVAATSPEEWTPLLAHDPAVRLEDVDAFAGHLVVSQRSGGMTRVRVLTLGGEQGEQGEQGVNEDFLVEFGEPLYTVGVGANPEFGQPRLRLGHTTLATPPAVYDFDVTTRELRLLKQTPVLGGFDPADYEQVREWAEAEDGTRVPISLVCRKGTPRDGSAPLVLYGYGSYEHSQDPAFSVARLSLLDRGVVYAIAHVRGGGEMGRRWYDEGKLLAKRNTFTDYLACARHLGETGWTRPDRLVAEGGSAGGLLVGAAATMAPRMFAGVLAVVPFVDALTTILDPSLPLTAGEWEEWGNPIEDPEVYAYMKSYSPYENVTAQRYPPMLVETSLHDTRVFYVEAAKWVARLRATASGSEQILLRTEMSAGHGGVSGRYRAWRDRAFRQAWVLDRLGRAGTGAED